MTHAKTDAFSLQAINTDALKARLRDYADKKLTRRNNNKYNCPICGSGTGSNNTPAFSIEPNGYKWKCFSCNESGDLFDLIGIVEGLETYPQRVNFAAELFGEVAEHHPAPTQTPQQANDPADTNTDETEQDYTTFFLQANKNLPFTDYTRGISADTLNRYKVGFVDNWKHPKAPNAPGTPRLIIPTSKSSYLARDIRNEIPQEQKGYEKSKVGKQHFFNFKALQTSGKPVFITEGELDALSIIDAGGDAVALGSTSNADAFLQAVKDTKPARLLLLAFDNDEPGRKAEEKLARGLDGAKIPFYRVDINGTEKDPNEALNANRSEFLRRIKQAEKAGQKEYTRNFSAGAFLRDFKDGIKENANTPAIKTGFSKLDNALDEIEGGIYEGLYILGAISSLGKTTFIQQIADSIAQQGRDVLFFSLEMARTELISKSISRHTAEIILQTGGSANHMKTARGITDGKRYKTYSAEEKILISNAINAYEQYADHVFIFEGMGNIGTAQIRDAVEKHIFFTGEKPLVIVDYFQMLAAPNERATDKQNADRNIIELKRISRDFKIPVIAISSFNRENYSAEATMKAFKETGAIEYTADVLIGLQLQGAGEKTFDEILEKGKDPRTIEAVILKNRNGKTGEKITFFYYPRFNYFLEN